jgi:hypothetical protein
MSSMGSMPALRDRLESFKPSEASQLPGRGPRIVGRDIVVAVCRISERPIAAVRHLCIVSRLSLALVIHAKLLVGED